MSPKKSIEQELEKTLNYVDEVLGRYKSLKKDLKEEVEMASLTNESLYMKLAKELTYG